MWLFAALLVLPAYLFPLALLVWLVRR